MFNYIHKKPFKKDEGYNATDLPMIQSLFALKQVNKFDSNREYDENNPVLNAIINQVPLPKPIFDSQQDLVTESDN